MICSTCCEKQEKFYGEMDVTRHCGIDFPEGSPNEVKVYIV